MSLLFDSMEKCIFMNKKITPDGEGGYYAEWTEGAEFNAAIVFDSSMEARIGDKSGVTSLYTVSAEIGVPLDYHDVFKRVSDGKVFRITSDGDDKKTPKSSTFNIHQVTAEEWAPA